MSYDNDGTVVAYGAAAGSAAVAFSSGLTTYASGSQKIEMNDGDYVVLSPDIGVGSSAGANVLGLWLFFPEIREVTALYAGFDDAYQTYSASNGLARMDGSNDTTNGVDGTWETASWPGGQVATGPSLDNWRRSILPVSFTGGKRTIRIAITCDTSFANLSLRALHIHGEKAAGETPDDLIFIDHDTTPGVEYTAPEDFGDRPLGTSVVRQFRVKNASATLTANSINLQLNDSDFTISTDGTTWVQTINIASLAAGAESATLYIRNTTPAPGSALGPRFARIIAIVGSWS